MRRRRFLTVTAAAGALLAGCQGGGPAGGSGGTDNGTGGTTTQAMATGTTDGGGASLPDHEALAGLSSQPYLGPPPGEAEGLIVAFEDPSCPTCATFDFRVLPEIRKNLVETGKATFVFRGYPVIYPWGKQGVRALEATLDADETAFWELLAHYFDNQDAFQGKEPSAVYDGTAAYLSDNTDLDGTAVIDRARAGEVDGAVKTDLDAGMAAGAGQVTPTLFLFSGGEYLTKARGSISYRVIESALGV